ncbi:MAG: hypothetical protein JXB49_28455 [Bacteroidales bacterium]|nr:hypothetical protein [Bacteroidales bacterium]
MHKVYDFVNQIIHLNDLMHISSSSQKKSGVKCCPITGLDISMQPKNSKFLSYTGVKWYYEHNSAVFEKELLTRLTPECKKKDVEIQFREIAHSIRNADSNPRHNTRRKIQRLLQEQDCLFNNMQLIDKRKLKEAGIFK